MVLLCCQDFWREEYIISATVPSNLGTVADSARSALGLKDAWNFLVGRTNTANRVSGTPEIPLCNSS